MNTYDLQYWAERTIKSDAWQATKSLHNKRGGNPYSYSNTAVVEYYLTHLTEAEFVSARNAYIANNPMKYSATTKKLVYLAK